MAHVNKLNEQLEWWNSLDEEALHKCTWDLLTSGHASDEQMFFHWRVMCMFEAKLHLNMGLCDFDPQQFYNLQPLNQALCNLALETNWFLVEWMLFRTSRLDPCCVMHKINFEKTCLAHLDDIVLLTFASISQTSQLNRFWTLLEITTSESKLAICNRLAQTRHSTTFMVELCTFLHKVLVSTSMLEAVSSINALINLISNKKHHFTLTLITKYPFLTLDQESNERDLACVVYTPFDSQKCKTQTLSNGNTMIIGMHRNSLALGYKRSFVLAFDQASRKLVWGHEIKNDGYNKLIVNDSAVAIVPSDHNPALKAFVYELATGCLVAVLTKPHQDSCLSPSMDTWTTRIYANGMTCVNAITSEIKYQESKCPQGKLTPFVFGFLLSYKNLLRVCYFSQYEMEVPECLAYKLHGNLLGVVCKRHSTMWSVYKLQPHGVNLQQMTILPFIDNPKIVSLDQSAAAVLHHKDGFLFCSGSPPFNVVEVFCEVKCWAHRHATPTVVWIWDRTTKKLTRVTAAQGAIDAGRLSFIQDIVHAQDETVYVI